MSVQPGCQVDTVFRVEAVGGFDLRLPAVLSRGLAILGDKLFLAALDARLIALDAKTGRVLWTTPVADQKLQYSFTVAPLVVKDKVILGPAGGEYGIRGFLAAFE